MLILVDMLGLRLMHRSILRYYFLFYNSSEIPIYCIRWAYIQRPQILSRVKRSFREQRFIEDIFGSSEILGRCTEFEEGRIGIQLLELIAVLRALTKYLTLTSCEILSIDFSIGMVIGFAFLTEIVVCDGIFLHIIFYLTNISSNQTIMVPCAFFHLQNYPQLVNQIPVLNDLGNFKYFQFQPIETYNILYSSLYQSGLMHDDDIGRKCAICSRKDYIPYTCKKCNSVLCDEHYWEHPCVSNQYEKHKAQNQFAEQGKRGGKQENKKVYYCGVCKKKLYTVNHYYCEKCEKLYCLSHRFPEQHKCTATQGNCQLI